MANVKGLLYYANKLLHNLINILQLIINYMEMNTFGERLKSILKENDFRAFDLSEKTKRSRQTISNYLNNKTIPDFDFLGMLISLFPNLSLNWLITGQGKVYVSDTNTASEDVEDLKKQINELKEEHITLMGAIRTLTSIEKRSFNKVVRETGDKITRIDEKIARVVSYSNLYRRVQKSTVERTASL